MNKISQIRPETQPQRPGLRARSFAANLADAALADARRIFQVDDLPSKAEIQAYQWTDGMGGYHFTIQGKRDRQILDRLKPVPAFAASLVRISAPVKRLRKCGLPIFKEIFADDRNGNRRYGIYRLGVRVVLVERAMPDG